MSVISERADGERLAESGRGGPDQRLSMLAPLADAAWPDKVAHMLDGFAGQLNVYRVMAHHPALLQAWSDYRNHVVLENALGAELSEVAILRTGHRLGSPYEWAHHVKRARLLGMEDARIASIAGGLADMRPEDGIVARAVDELLAGARLAEQTRRSAVDLLGPEGVLDLMATVGLYSTLAFIVNSFDTPVDQVVVQELAEQPLR